MTVSIGKIASGTLQGAVRTAGRNEQLLRKAFAFVEGHKNQQQLSEADHRKVMSDLYANLGGNPKLAHTAVYALSTYTTAHIRAHQSKILSSHIKDAQARVDGKNEVPFLKMKKSSANEVARDAAASARKALCDALTAAGNVPV